MEKILSISLFFILLHFSGKAQALCRLSGEIVDCDNPKMVLPATVSLEKDGQLVKMAPIVPTGKFDFPALEQGSYTLRVNYLSFPEKVLQISPQDNAGIRICLSTEIPNPIPASWTSRIYTKYFYGLPRYSDEEINEFAIKYGVRYQNMGCELSNEWDRHNEIVDQILNARNGMAWAVKMWQEICEKDQKNR